MAASTGACRRCCLWLFDFDGNAPLNAMSPQDFQPFHLDRHCAPFEPVVYMRNSVHVRLVTDCRWTLICEDESQEFMQALAGNVLTTHRYRHRQTQTHAKLDVVLSFHQFAATQPTQLFIYLFSFVAKSLRYFVVCCEQRGHTLARTRVRMLCT